MTFWRSHPKYGDLLQVSSCGRVRQFQFKSGRYVELRVRPARKRKDNKRDGAHVNLMAPIRLKRVIVRKLMGECMRASMLHIHRLLLEGGAPPTRVACLLRLDVGGEWTCPPKRFKRTTCPLLKVLRTRRQQVLQQQRHRLWSLLRCAGVGRSKAADLLECDFSSLTPIPGRTKKFRKRCPLLRWRARKRKSTARGFREKWHLRRSTNERLASLLAAGGVTRNKAAKMLKCSTRMIGPAMRSKRRPGRPKMQQCPLIEKESP